MSALSSTTYIRDNPTQKSAFGPLHIPYTQMNARSWPSMTDIRLRGRMRTSTYYRPVPTHLLFRSRSDCRCLRTAACRISTDSNTDLPVYDITRLILQQGTCCEQTDTVCYAVFPRNCDTFWTRAMLISHARHKSSTCIPGRYGGCLVGKVETLIV